MPEILAVAVSLLLLNVWYLASLSINEKLIPKSYELILNAIILFAATFFGSYVAFKLNEKKELKKLKLKQKEALDMSLFVLIRLIQGFQYIEEQLDQYPTIDEKVFNMASFEVTDYQHLKFNVNELSFLFEHDPQILLDLVTEKDRFDQLLRALDARHEFHLNYVVKKLIDSGFYNEVVDLDKVKSILGESTYNDAYTFVKNIDEHTKAIAESLPKSYSRLSRLARKLYPETPFLQLNV